MGIRVNGKWQDDDRFPVDPNGAFLRPPSTFRGRISRDRSTPFPAERDRYHLFVAWGCPWAHRSILYRRLKGLEDVVTASFSTGMGPEGWTFADSADGKRSDEIAPIGGVLHLHRVYSVADSTFTGRVTVPVLWDKIAGTIVNN